MSPALSLIVEVSLAIVGLALLLAAYRVVRGPSTPDRVVALDAIAVIVVGLVGLWSIRQETSAFFDSALIVALLGFLGTVAFSRALVGRGPLE